VLLLPNSERGGSDGKQGAKACDCYCCDNDRSHPEGAPGEHRRPRAKHLLVITDQRRREAALGKVEVHQTTETGEWAASR
jgi:hypothetical protein